MRCEYELRCLREANQQMRDENDALEKRLLNIKRANSELEKGREADKDNLQALQKSNNGLKERVQYLENKSVDSNNESLQEIKDLSDELKVLEQNIQVLKMGHKKETSNLQAKAILLSESNSKLEARRKSVDNQVGNLEARVQSMEAQARHSGTVIAKFETEMQLKDDDNSRMKAALDKAHKDLHDKGIKHADDTAQFQRKMREKDEHAQRLQSELRHTQTMVLNMRRSQPTQQQHSAPMLSQHSPGTGLALKLENQRSISCEAHERSLDLQSKLDATEIELRAKTVEIGTLKEKLNDKAATALDLEKKCVDYASRVVAL